MRMEIKDANNLTHLISGLAGEGRTVSRPGAGAANPSKAGAPGAGGPNSADQLHVTGTAARLQALEARLAGIPVVDTQRVAAVRQTLDQGRFVTDSHRIAHKLVQIEQRLPPAGR